MRKVKFIKSLNIEEKMVFDINEGIQYYNYTPIVQDFDDKLEVMASIDYERKIVPIHHLRESREYRRRCPNKIITTDTYIAYSEEVEKLLDLPFNYLKKRNESLEILLSSEEKSNKLLQKKVNKYKELSFWKKLYFLFDIHKEI